MHLFAPSSPRGPLSMTSTTWSRARVVPTAVAAALAAAVFMSAPGARAQFAAPIDTTVDAQLFQPAIGPRNGPYSWNRRFITPVPRVSVSNSP